MILVIIIDTKEVPLKKYSLRPATKYISSRYARYQIYAVHLHRAYIDLYLAVVALLIMI